MNVFSVGTKMMSLRHDPAERKSKSNRKNEIARSCNMLKDGVYIYVCILLQQQRL